MQHFNNSLDNVDNIGIILDCPFDEPLTSQTKPEYMGIFTELRQM